MYIIRNQEELGDYLDYCSLRPGEDFTVECLKEWSKERAAQGYTGYSETEDKIVINARGMWFDKDISTSFAALML